MSYFRLTRGNVYADILLDRRGPKDIWMYVVQREGSPEILAMGSCRTEAECRKTAAQALKQFESRSASA